MRASLFLCLLLLFGPTLRGADAHYVKLDPELVQSMLELIARVAAARTVVCVTHELGFARRLGERAIFIAEGAIVEQGAPSKLFDEPKSDRLRGFLRQVMR